MTYIVERFGGKKLTNQAQIPIFTQGRDTENHIKTCEKEWKRLGYKDERTWPHLFPSMLSDLPNKWYKMEEDRGETFLWHELRENFIKDFSFIPQNEKLVETAKQIKAFNNTLTQNYDRPKITCNNIQTKTTPQSTRIQMENENLERKSFLWKSYHLETTKPIRTVLKFKTVDEEDTD